MTVHSDPSTFGVVIPCFNCAGVLRRCVESVLASAASCPWVKGIYLVDGGSTDTTSELCQELAAHPLVHVLRHDASSASAKRNAALRRVEADFLVFTDPDCITTAEWLSAYSKAALEWSCCTGRVTPLVPGLATAIRTSYKDRTYQPRLLWRAFAFRAGSSNNLMISRDLLMQLGGFPEDLGPGTSNGVAEDTEVLYRALRAGVPIRYCPGAEVQHDHPETTEVYLLKKELYARGLSYFMFKRYRSDPATYLSFTVMMGHSLGRWLFHTMFFNRFGRIQAYRELRGRYRGLLDGAGCSVRHPAENEEETPPGGEP